MSDRFPRGRNWRSAPVYEKPLSARVVLARALGISTDEAGDALTALIQGGYGVAPRNPTNGMLIAYLEALTPPTGHEATVTAIGKARVRWQAMLAQGTAMSMSLKRVERDFAAIATEAQRATTVEQGVVHEGADPQGIAQGQQP